MGLGVGALQDARPEERPALLVALAGEWGVMAGAGVVNSHTRFQVQAQAGRFGLDAASALAAYDEGVEWRRRVAVPTQRARHRLIDALDLGPTDTLLLRRLAFYTDPETGLAWPGRDRLVWETHLDPRTVRYVLDRLRERGFIRRVGSDRGGRLGSTRHGIEWSVLDEYASANPRNLVPPQIVRRARRRRAENPVVGGNAVPPSTVPVAPTQGGNGLPAEPDAPEPSDEEQRVLKKGEDLRGGREPQAPTTPPTPKESTEKEHPERPPNNDAIEPLDGTDEWRSL